MADPPVCDAEFLALLDAVGAEAFGAANLCGPRLARAVEHVSGHYLRQAGVPSDLRGDSAALCARLKFFLPRDLPKVQAPLAELASVDALPKRRVLRVLDLGAGLLTTSLGSAEFLFGRGMIDRLEVDALDVDGRALEIGQRVTTRWARARGAALHVKTHVTSLGAAALTRLTPPYDLILLGFVLNELGERETDRVAHHRGWLERLCGLLAADGVLIALEPALREPSRALQQVRDELSAACGPPYVFAPCLHREPCPLLKRERDWCHALLRRSFPEPLATLARDAGLRSDDPTFSYLTLHQAPRSLVERGAGEPLYRIVSNPLRSKGKLEFAVCASGPIDRIRRLDRRSSPENEAMSELGRGDLVFVRLGRESGPTVLDVRAETKVERNRSC